MAQTYAELKRRVQLLIDRSDAETQVASDNTEVDMLDVFIANAEKRFYRSEAARIPPLEKFVTFTVGAGVGVHELAIPSDYFETRYITALGTNNQQYTLTRTSPEIILNVNTKAATRTIPDEFAYGNNEWLIRQGTQQVTITANYYGFLDALSTITHADSDNWILNNADDLIMYWAASEAGMYYGSLDPSMVERWEQRAAEIANNIVEQEVRQQSSGSTPKMRRAYRL